jgi:hypothetical protein
MHASRNFLTDSNERRKISNLDRLNVEGVQFRLPLDLNSPQVPEVTIDQPIISQYLENGSEQVKKSTIKYLEQCEIYKESVKLYNLHTGH